jgi:hypothetical protein
MGDEHHAVSIVGEQQTVLVLNPVWPNASFDRR